MTNTDWIKDAPCAQLTITDDSDAPRIIDFFSEDPVEVERAKAVCVECPFRLKCLQYAYDNKERWGTWGGAEQQELRTNQSINEFGEQQTYKKTPIFCSYCRPGNSELNILDKKRTRTHLECNVCGLDWVTRKGINDRRTNL
jgi:hypothetical protein